MSEIRKNWENYEPPLVPIYFMEYGHLKHLLENTENPVSPQGCEMMLGYFEEYEEFEKAALVRDYQWRQNNKEDDEGIQANA